MSRGRKRTVKSKPCVVCGELTRERPACPDCAIEIAQMYYSDDQFRRHRQRLWDYDITEQEFNALYVVQAGRCAICKLRPEQPTDLVVDHDHDTGETRGLLCSPCNVGLGMFKDTPRHLHEAARYLAEPPRTRI